MPSELSLMVHMFSLVKRLISYLKFIHFTT